MGRASFGGSNTDYSSLFASLYKQTSSDQESKVREEINAEIQRLQSELAAGRLTKEQYAAALQAVVGRLRGIDEAAAWNLQETVNSIVTGLADEQQNIQDQKMASDWEAGLVSDDDWLAYIQQRASTESDPAKRAQWAEYYTKYNASIQTNRAEFAYQNGGNINDIIAFYQTRLGSLEPDSNEYREASLRLTDLLDKRAGDSLTDGAQSIMNAIEDGKATYKDLLKFYKDRLFTVRPGSELEKQLKSEIGKVEDQIRAVDTEARMSKLDYDWQRGALTGKQYAAALRKEAEAYKLSDPKTYYSLLKSALELDKYGNRTSIQGLPGTGGSGSSSKKLAATIDALQAGRNYWKGIAEEIEKDAAQVYDATTGTYVPVSNALKKQVAIELTKTYDALAAAHEAKGDASAAASDRNAKAEFLAGPVATWNSMRVEDSRQHMITTVNKMVQDAINEPDPNRAAWMLGQAAGVYERWATKVYTITEAKTKYVTGPDGTRREVVDPNRTTYSMKTGLQGFESDKVKEDNANIQMLRLASQSFIPGPAGQAARDQLSQGMISVASGLDAGPGSIADNAIAAATRLQGESEGKVAMYIKEDGKWGNTLGTPGTKWVLDQEGNQVPVPTYTLSPDLREGQKLVDAIVDVNGHARVVKVVANPVSTGYEGYFAAKGFTITSGSGKTSKNTIRVAEGGRISQSDLAALQKAYPDGWEAYVRKGPALTYYQVQLPSRNGGVKIFSQDPDTNIWVEGQTLPMWHIETYADGTVKFDDMGNIVADKLAFQDHYGVPVPSTASDPRESQDILNSGALDDSWKLIKGTDMNGRVTTATADKGITYYDPRDNEAARAIARVQKEPEEQDWFDSKTRRSRADRARAAAVSEARERLARSQGTLRPQPSGKGPYDPLGPAFAAANKAPSTPAGTDFDTMAEKIGINLAGTQAQAASANAGYSPFWSALGSITSPASYTSSWLPPANVPSYSGPSASSGANKTSLPTIASTGSVLAPNINKALQADLRYGDATDQKVVFRPPSLTQAEREAENAAKALAAKTNKAVAF